MRSAGYTLVELLVVISIISMMAVLGFVNYKGFAADQATKKALGEIQSILRLAQSNATSQTLCNNQSARIWQIILDTGSAQSAKNIILECLNESGGATQKIYSLENAEISSITGSGGAGCSDLHVTISYTTGVGTPDFSGLKSNCIKNSNSLTITVRNINNLSSTKTLDLSKGGTINVQ